jgi:hypothetical protein
LVIPSQAVLLPAFKQAANHISPVFLEELQLLAICTKKQSAMGW